MVTAQDKPFTKRSAWIQMVVTALTLVALYFPDWDAKIKIVIGIIQQIATFVFVDQTTRSVDMKSLDQAGVRLLERDGSPVPHDTL